MFIPPFSRSRQVDRYKDEALRQILGAIRKFRTFAVDLLRFQ
jgi:hypothetical protein